MRFHAPPLGPVSQAAFAQLPPFPDSQPLTFGLWSDLSSVFGACQPVLAELSYFSLHLWRGGDDIAISRAGDFLVLRFAGPEDEAMVVAMPGAAASDEIGAAVESLAGCRDVRFLSTATADALGPALEYLDRTTSSERDNADYVFSLSSLATLEGPALKGRRREAGRFARRHQDGIPGAGRARVEQGRLSDEWAAEHLSIAYERWLASKYPDGQVPEAVAYERAGVMGWPGDARAAHVRVFCLYVDDEPRGVSVVEPMWNATWMGIVFKADPALLGASAFLRQAVARVGVAEVGRGGWINIQQDDGVPGLRAAKLSYQPVRLEPKFAVTVNRVRELQPC